MHYVRLKGPPKINVVADGIKTSVTFEVANDLGDDLLAPMDPVGITVKAYAESSPYANVSCSLIERCPLEWGRRHRVMKPMFKLPPKIENAIAGGDSVSLSIGPANPELAADSIYNILKSSIKDQKHGGAHGLISTAKVGLSGPDVDNDASLRQILLSGRGEPAQYLIIGEQIGHSIARHIWDGGLVSLSAIAGTFKFPELETSQSSCMKKVHEILTQEDGVNVLELGCGVGILGVGLCAVYPKGMGDCTILMTDCDDAERGARSNMGRLHQQRSGSNLGYAQVMYENLDWNNGCQGRFGPKVQDRRWDLIMLSDCTYNADSIPALVGTLSAVHKQNKSFDPDDGDFATTVFLATKPRHDDELVLFDMMAAEGWTVKDKLVLSLPVLGRESETVEMYLFEKA
ncbi:hypothetical protein E4U57_006639 [Claviceps arundinis]|uniref:Uncharacterized protein n=1 Tax=Claviceps arundinis TaxID=1623583 RepID=A0A9P7MX42_9HYPO|nr:hypothetical protein E4U57_006639 [Claviceps arundinis]KAG5972649.1 hypothetical protein E4U56_005840 [Claviceps arundinis]